MGSGIGHSSFLLRIDADLCRVCKVCTARRECRSGAIRIIDRGEMPVLDLSLCWGCLMCTVACPNRAIVRLDQTL